MKKDEALSFPKRMMPNSEHEAELFKAAILAAIPAAMAQGYKERQISQEASNEERAWEVLEITTMDPACFDDEAKSALMMAMAVLENYRAANYE